MKLYNPYVAIKNRLAIGLVSRGVQAVLFFLAAAWAAQQEVSTTHSVLFGAFACGVVLRTIDLIIGIAAYMAD